MMGHNNQDDIYSAIIMTKVIAKSSLGSLDECRTAPKRPPTVRPSRLTGAVSQHQQTNTNTQHFTGRTSFLSPTQSVKALKGKRYDDPRTCSPQAHPGSSNLDIAPLRSESPPQKHSGMARVLKGFHSFTCTPTRSSASGMSHTCLCLPNPSWGSFTDPGGMEG